MTIDKNNLIKMSIKNETGFVRTFHILKGYISKPVQVCSNGHGSKTHDQN